MNRIAAHILVIGLAAASAIPGRVAHACQDTTVRLAAFTLPRDTHVLCVIGAAGDPVADETAARLGDWLASEGADLNIEVEHVVADDPDVPWRDYALPGPPPELPVVALVGHQAATGARFIIDHWEPARDAPSPASILSDADLAALATSPAREAIKANVIDHFAVLLYAPGPDTARPAVGRAIEDYADATGEAIALVTVDRSDPRERVLLSFAGIAEDGPDWAGVVFGRGKLAAPPLEGADITEANLSMLFDAVAAPCTCIESPATLGVDMPLAWEASLDALTAPLLPPAYSEGVLEGLTLDTPRPAPPVMDSEPVPDAGPGLLGAAAGAAGAAAAVAGGAMLLVFVRFRRRNASR